MENESHGGGTESRRVSLYTKVNTRKSQKGAQTLDLFGDVPSAHVKNTEPTLAADWKAIIQEYLRAHELYEMIGCKVETKVGSQQRVDIVLYSKSTDEIFCAWEVKTPESEKRLPLEAVLKGQATRYAKELWGQYDDDKARLLMVTNGDRVRGSVVRNGEPPCPVMTWEHTTHLASLSDWTGASQRIAEEQFRSWLPEWFDWVRLHRPDVFPSDPLPDGPLRLEQREVVQRLLELIQQFGFELRPSLQAQCQDPAVLEQMMGALATYKWQSYLTAAGSERDLENQWRTVANYMGLLMLIQLMAYQVARRTPLGDELPEVDWGNQALGAQWIEMLRKAEQVTKLGTVFTTRMWEPVQLPNEMVKHLRAMTHMLDRIWPMMEQGSHEILGLVYNYLTPPSFRQERGMYFTPSFLAELLTHWAVRDLDDVAWDSTSGGGVFLLAIYHQKLKLWQEQHRALQSLDQHEGILSRIWGVDMDPFSAMLSTLNLMFFNTSASWNRPLVLNADTLTLPLHHTEALPWGPTHGTTATMPLFDVAVGNPPYVGGYKLDADQRKQWQNSLGQLVRDLVKDATRQGSEAAPDLASLWRTEGSSIYVAGIKLMNSTDLAVYMMIADLLRLKPGGRLAKIVTNSWLSTQSGAVMRAFLRRTCTHITIVGTSVEHWFPHTPQATVLLVAERTPYAVASDDPITFVNMHRPLEELVDEHGGEEGFWRWLETMDADHPSVGVSLVRKHPAEVDRGIETETDALNVAVPGLAPWSGWMQSAELQSVGFFQWGSALPWVSLQETGTVSRGFEIGDVRSLYVDEATRQRESLHDHLLPLITKAPDGLVAHPQAWMVDVDRQVGEWVSTQADVSDPMVTYLTDRMERSTDDPLWVPRHVQTPKKGSGAVAFPIAIARSPWYGFMVPTPSKTNKSFVLWTPADGQEEWSWPTVLWSASTWHLLRMMNMATWVGKGYYTVKVEDVATGWVPKWADPAWAPLQKIAMQWRDRLKDRTWTSWTEWLNDPDLHEWNRQIWDFVGVPEAHRVVAHQLLAERVDHLMQWSTRDLELTSRTALFVENPSADLTEILNASQLDYHWPYEMPISGVRWGTIGELLGLGHSGQGGIYEFFGQWEWEGKSRSGDTMRLDLSANHLTWVVYWIQFQQQHHLLGDVVPLSLPCPLTEDDARAVASAYREWEAEVAKVLHKTATTLARDQAWIDLRMAQLSTLAMRDADGRSV